MTYETIRPVVGGSLADGKAYHDIPGAEGPTYRNNSQARADQIAAAIDVDGKTGLDLGCSVGGVSFGLVKHRATMLGVDHDEAAIALANAHASGVSAEFIHGDLADGQTWGDVLADDYDFAIWLANWMWVAHAAGVPFARERLHDLSERIPTLVFETAQAGGSTAGTFGIATDDDVVALLRSHTTYTDIRCIGPVADGWHARSLFVATGG